MVITEQWIMENATERGGYTMKQLAAIGVDWPPISGWKAQAIGREITEEQRSIFEAKEPI